MKNNKGQAAISYVLIVSITSIIVISTVKYFSGYLKDTITKASCNLAGIDYISGTKTGDGSCKSIIGE